MNRPIGQEQRETAVALELSSHLLHEEKDQEDLLMQMEAKLAVLRKGIKILAEIQILRPHTNQDKNAKVQLDHRLQVKLTNQKQACQEVAAPQRKMPKDLIQLKKTTQSPECP